MAGLSGRRGAADRGDRAGSAARAPNDGMLGLSRSRRGLRPRAQARSGPRVRDNKGVKPPDEKWFGARVYATGAEIDVAEGMEDEYPVLISEPVVFEVEYRFFVLERGIAAGSIYIRGGEIARGGEGEWRADPADTAAATEFLEGMLRDPAAPLPAAVVVDVGRTQDRGWAVVEANPAWASGLCDADPLAVLGVLRRATVPRAALVEADRRWVRGATT